MDMQGSVTLADRVHEIEGIGWNEHIHCPLADFAGPLVYDGYLDAFRLADLFSSRRSLAAKSCPSFGCVGVSACKGCQASRNACSVAA